MTARAPAGRFPHAGAHMLVGMCALLAGCGDAAPTVPPDLPPIGEIIDLRPGEARVLDSPELLSSFRLQGAAEVRAYVLVVQNSSESGTDPALLRVTIQRVGLSGAASTSRGPRPGPGARVPRDAEPDGRAEREILLRARVRRDLKRAGVRPARPASAAAASRGPGGAARAGPASARALASRIAGIPVPGQRLSFTSPVQADGSFATCSAGTPVEGVVRAVGERFALVEDTAVAGQLDDADYADLLAELESTVFPVVSDYFGTPLDIDGNGRVIALLSAAVNRLGAAGFFTPSDLADPAECPTSNAGELLWLIAPDPQGTYSDPILPGFVRERLPGIVAHELQHLINAEHRIFGPGGGFDDLEAAWLNEGLSHIAEEVAGLRAAGLSPGGNVGSLGVETAAGRALFQRYHLTNLRNVRDYLREPREVPALAGALLTRTDFRRVRGFGYLFLRWLADRLSHANGAPVASAVEPDLFRELASGGEGRSTSTENVVRAATRVTGLPLSWNRLFSEYVAAPAVDDLAAEWAQVGPESQIASWNLPRLFEGLRDNGFSMDFPEGFPLEETVLLLVTRSDRPFESDLSLTAPGASYFRIQGGQTTPHALIRITAPGGGALPAGSPIVVTIVRTA